ncbi:hypothetical protein ACFQZZ_26735 [Nocardia sp. GCM10030253]|uniref:hypothetical protein n=1 Tax=Nocardia sp. GCM10030253 TaxID=3273404 RepID=UPI003628B42D
MASKRPVNRVTPRNRPAADRAGSQTAATRRTGGPRRGADEQRTASTRRPRVAGSVETSDHGKPQPNAPRPPRRLLRPMGSGWRLVLTCVLATALLTAFAVLAAFRPGVDDSNEAFVNTKATEEVSAAAEHALRTVFAYDVKQLDGYKDAVRQVVTGQMLTDFDKFADTNIAAIKQAQTSADVEATPIGVTLLTDDRAELMVNLVVSANKDGVAQESASGPVVLRMQKKDGRWLASDIVDRN